MKKRNKGDKGMTGKKILLLALVTLTICLFLGGCTPNPRIIDLEVARANKQLQYGRFSDAYYCDISFDESTLQVDGESAICNGMVNEDFCDILKIQGTSRSNWRYDKEERQWTHLSDSLDVYATLGINVEGSWKIYDSNQYICVRNQTEDSLEIYVEGFSIFGDDWVCVELETSTLVTELTDALREGRCQVVYRGENADADTITVTFSMEVDGKLCLTVHSSGGFAIGHNSRHSYYPDFVPSNS